jgi:hypothetical protein
MAKKPDTEVYQGQHLQRLGLPIVEAKKAEFVSGEHAMCGCFALKPAPGHTPGQIRRRSRIARQAGDLRG